MIGSVFFIFIIIVALNYYYRIQRKFYGRLIFLSASTMFLLGFLLVHFQIHLLYLLDYKIDVKIFETWYWSDILIREESLYFSLIALVAYLLGYKNYKGFKGIKGTGYSESLLISSRKVFVFSSYIFYSAFFVTSGSYKYGLYMVGDEMMVSPYFYAGFNISLTASLIISSYMSMKGFKIIKNKSDVINLYGLSLNIIGVWHVLFSLYVGDRGPVITYSLLYVMPLLTVLNRKISFTKVMVFTLLLANFMSIVGAARTKESSDYHGRISKASYENRYSGNFSDNIPLKSTLELALSGRCLNHAISKVPEEYNFRYGMYQFQQLLAIIPFAAGFNKNYISKYENHFDSSADFSTFLIQGNNPDSGDGTTIITDFYLDYGIVGIVLGMFLFGMLLRFVDNAIIGNQDVTFFQWIICALYFSGALYISRATALFYLQRVFQIWFIVILIMSLVKITRARFE